MADDFSSYSTGLDSPARKAFAITPHNTNELSSVTRGIFVGVAGDVAAILAGDTVAVTFKGVSGMLAIRAKVILVTGTTATDIVGLV
jgi:hypothetical protein